MQIMLTFCYSYVIGISDAKGVNQRGLFINREGKLNYNYYIFAHINDAKSICHNDGDNDF